MLVSRQPVEGYECVDIMICCCCRAIEEQTHQLDATTTLAGAARPALQERSTVRTSTWNCSWACSCILIYLPVAASGANRCCSKALLLYPSHDLRKRLADVSDVHTCGRIRAAEAKATQVCCTMGLFCRLLLRTAQALDHWPLAACTASRGITSATINMNKINAAAFNPFDACYAGDSQDHT
jgi:hypothetical protein